METRHSKNKSKLPQYIIGFVLSIVLTFGSYILVTNHLLVSPWLLITIMIFAVFQLVVQLLFFLHLSSEPNPNWNLILVINTVSIILLIVGASIWIMNHLNYNMTPQKMNQHILEDEGMQTTNSQKTTLPSATPRYEIKITSPDKRYLASYYYKGGFQGEEGPHFNFVDVLDTTSNQIKSHPLKGQIIMAEGRFYWSPVNNKIYFTRGTNGIGNYALWSSDVDGNNETLISGKPENPPFKDSYTNSAIFGAENWEFSPNGKLLLTSRPVYDKNDADYHSELWLMADDGANSHKIPISGTYSIKTITWESDGQHLTFVTSDKAGVSGRKYRSDINGATLEELKY